MKMPVVIVFINVLALSQYRESREIFVSMHIALLYHYASQSIALSDSGQ